MKDYSRHDTSVDLAFNQLKSETFFSFFLRGGGGGGATEQRLISVNMRSVDAGR